MRSVRPSIATANLRDSGRERRPFPKRSRHSPEEKNDLLHSACAFRSRTAVREGGGVAESVGREAVDAAGVASGELLGSWKARKRKEAVSRRLLRETLWFLACFGVGVVQWELDPRTVLDFQAAIVIGVLLYGEVGVFRFPYWGIRRFIRERRGLAKAELP